MPPKKGSGRGRSKVAESVTTDNTVKSKLAKEIAVTEDEPLINGKSEDISNGENSDALPSHQPIDTDINTEIKNKNDKIELEVEAPEESENNLDEMNTKPTDNSEPVAKRGRKKANSSENEDNPKKLKVIEPLNDVQELELNGKLEADLKNDDKNSEEFIEKDSMEAKNISDKQEVITKEFESEENCSVAKNSNEEDPKSQTVSKRGRKKANEPVTDMSTEMEDPDPTVEVPQKKRKKDEAADNINEEDNIELEATKRPRAGRNKKEETEVDIPLKETSRAGRNKKEAAKVDVPIKVTSRSGRNKKEETEVDAPIKRTSRAARNKKEETKVDVPTKETSRPGRNKKEETKVDVPLKETSRPGRNKKEETEVEVPIKETSRAGRNKKKQTEVEIPIKETTKSGRNRKNVEKRSADSDNDDLKNLENEKRILKVTLTRDVEIDKLITEKAGSKKQAIEETDGDESSTSKGKRTRDDVSDNAATEAKPAKIQKKAQETKGQSKKDKMPDVTLLDFENSSTSASKEPWNIKLSSWNVNGIRAWLEKDGLCYLKHESPDIMCIQETKCSKEKLPDEINRVENYHTYWLAGDQEGYSGVGLLSKEEPLSVTYGIGIEEHDNEGRVITAEYDKFYLVNTYVPNAGKKLVRLDYRMQWNKDFHSYLKSLDEKKPVILCGDLNVAHEEIDLANPKTNKKNAGFTVEEREAFTELLKDGFLDTYRHLYPDKKAYTFWTYMMNARAKDVGWRLDYFVISKRFVPNLCDSVIRKDVMGSDHCPTALFLHV